MPCACVKYPVIEVSCVEYDRHLSAVPDNWLDVVAFPYMYCVRATGKADVWPKAQRDVVMRFGETEGYFMRCLRPKDCGGKK